LSSQGKVEVASSKLWDYASFSDEPTLRSIWEKRDSIQINERALFALIASELANGDIGLRSWALFVPDDILVSCLCNGLVNFLYLAFRANENGVRQEPLIRAISYLIVVAIQRIDSATVSSLLVNVWNDVEDWEYPEKIKELILEPVLSTLQAELRDVCARDCWRVTTVFEVLQEAEIEVYWDRLKTGGLVERKNEPILTLESFKEPCNVGFPVDEKVGCPLCHMDKLHSNIDDFVRVVDQIIRYRSSEEHDV
jgi:hypothetical protein